MSTLYGYCCAYKNDDTGAELTLEVGDVFGRPWYAWEKYFTVTAVYHLDAPTLSNADIFFDAVVEDGKSIGNLTYYIKETYATTREKLITYDSNIRIAGVVTEDGEGLYRVNVVDGYELTTHDGKYLITKNSPFTGIVTPTKDGYTFTPESVEYEALTKCAVDDYTAEPTGPAVPSKPTIVSPADAATDVTLDQPDIEWADGGEADYYNVYYGETEETLALVSTWQEGTTFSLNGVALGAPFDYGVTRYWRIDAGNFYGITTGDVWSFTTITFAPPAPGVYGEGGGGGEGEGVSGENAIITRRRLVVAANNKIWYA